MKDFSGEDCDIVVAYDEIIGEEGETEIYEPVSGFANIAEARSSIPSNYYNDRIEKVKKQCPSESTSGKHSCYIWFFLPVRICA